MQVLQTNQCLRSIFRNALNIPIASVSTPLLNNFAAARPLGALRNRHSDPSPDGEEPAWSVPNLRKHMLRFAQQDSSERLDNSFQKPFLSFLRARRRIRLSRGRVGG